MWCLFSRGENPQCPWCIRGDLWYEKDEKQMSTWTTFLLLTFYETLVMFAALPTSTNLKKKMSIPECNGVTVEFHSALCACWRKRQWFWRWQGAPHLEVIVISSHFWCLLDGIMGHFLLLTINALIRVPLKKDKDLFSSWKLPKTLPNSAPILIFSCPSLVMKGQDNTGKLSYTLDSFSNFLKFFFVFLKFYWRIVDLQGWDHFCCTKWFSDTCTHIHSLSDSFPS